MIVTDKISSLLNHLTCILEMLTSLINGHIAWRNTNQTLLVERYFLLIEFFVCLIFHIFSLQYESVEEIQTLFNKGLETLRLQVACFDMGSILIKPVQRILKYPLILNELIKVRIKILFVKNI